MEGIEYSFVNGGPLANHLRKLGLLGRTQLTVAFRISLAVAITWLPLLLITASQGLAYGKKVQVPFLFDFIEQARFLVALPAAIWADRYISTSYHRILRRFLNASIVSSEDVPRFKRAISEANALKNSLVAEILIVGLAYLYRLLDLEMHLPIMYSSWGNFGSNAANAAVFWFHWISMPIFHFFWIRWLWRHGVWAYLLACIARLRLQLFSTHPDYAGGLNFVSVFHRRYAVFVFSVSAILCASIAQKIMVADASLLSFELELVIFYLICLMAILGPLMVFTPNLIRIKLRDITKYGILSANYTQDFDEKWIQGKRDSQEMLLGNSDFQSLADMQNSYRAVSGMRTILPDQKTVLIFFVAYLLPVLPLLTTIIPLQKILSAIFGLLQK